MKEIHDKIIKDIFKEIPGIRSRAMFGGHGLYKDGIIFGMIVHNKIYFKVGETNIADYQKTGSEPFTYIGASGKPVSMSYWTVPTSVLSNPKELLEWIQKSLKINSRKSTKRPSSRAKI